MVDRIINPSKSNSFFLFGARGTGKTYWLKNWIDPKHSIIFDLLDIELENLFQTKPQEFKAQINAALKNNPNLEWIIIDEVQKCPELLNYVHQFIENKGLKFAMSGSSARKLKQKGVNLLAGRAFMECLFPLTFLELGESFNLMEVLSFGSLPKLLELKEDQEKIDFLKAYSLTYIQNEIIAEQWVRNISPFRKFMPIASQMNTKIINTSRIAKDLGVDWSTVSNYFDILEDTLLGIRLEAYHRSVRKRQFQAPKFYFFDLGVCRAFKSLLHLHPHPGTGLFGELFENLVFIEIYRLNATLKKDFQLFYLKTQSGVEVDLILERKGSPTILIEIKSKESVSERDAKNLIQIGSEFKNKQMYVLSNDSMAKEFGEVSALEWKSGIKKIFDLS